MFGKLKDKANNVANQAATKAKDMKQNYDDNKKQQWISEVQLQDLNFKESKQWFEMYDPKKESKPSDPNQSESEMKKKIMQGMGNSISKNIVKYICEALAFANEFAAKSLAQSEPKIFNFLNSLTAVLLTYRFQAKNEKKFTFIRGVAVDRVSLNLVELLDFEAKKLGKQSEQIDAQTVNQIIDKIINIAQQQLENSKQIAIDQFKKSPLFAISGQSEQQVDEGVQLIIQTAQQYGEKKMGHLIDIARNILPQIIQTISQHQQQIRSHLAQQQQGQEPSEEYIQNCRGQIGDKFEQYHQQLYEKINKFVQGFFGIVDSQSQQ